MKIQNGYKTVIYYAVVIIAALIAYHVIPSLKVNDKYSVAFSPVRVAEDINIISKRPHSIEHPKERKVVRDYLFHRLDQMGGTVNVFEYDSIECKFGGYFDIANVYARFDPDHVTDSTQYVLLVAHMDSRFHQKVLKDTVYSYGAADDGYGLGVILESVYLALKYKEYWRQGIKVLFTDSEEHELDGMRNMAIKDNSVLENVNFVINVEARGVKGPALLFETARGNSKVMELYKKAKKPYTYSFTTLVYRVLPNDTDFSIVKDSIPGFNFAVIDNLRYYHTDLDNYSNISLTSLQHYGLQIEPILHQYLTSSKYARKESLVSDKDRIFFTIPLLGLFIFSKSNYILLNIIAFSLFFLALFFYLSLGKIRIKSVLKGLGYVSLFFAGSLIVGEIIAWVAAYCTGQEFDLVAVKYVKYDYIITITSVLILFLWILVFFRIKEKKQPLFAYDFLFGTLFFLFMISLLACVTVLENFFVLIPLLTSSVVLLLAIFKFNKFFYLVSAAIISLLGFSFFYCLITALTIGSLGVFLMFVSLYISLLIAQYYCYKRNLS